MVDQSHELLEFAGTTTNVYSKEEVYIHVVIKLWLTLMEDIPFLLLVSKLDVELIPPLAFRCGCWGNTCQCHVIPAAP